MNETIEKIESLLYISIITSTRILIGSYSMSYLNSLYYILSSSLQGEVFLEFKIRFLSEAMRCTENKLKRASHPVKP